MAQKHPVDNRELYLEIKLSKGCGRLTRRAGELFQVLAKGLIKKKQYTDEDDRNDCLQTALVSLFANWHSFDPERYSNAFAYFSEVTKRGLALGFNELHAKRGLEKGNYQRHISLNSTNKGEGLFNV